MKKALCIFLSTLFFGLVFSFCKKKDNSTNSPSGYTPDCSGATPSYAAEVSSILSTNCASSGCHNSGSSFGPGALVTYNQIKNSAASVRSSVVSGSMPKNSTLTTEQKNKIVCWIDAGAINN